MRLKGLSIRASRFPGKNLKNSMQRIGLKEEVSEIIIRDTMRVHFLFLNGVYFLARAGLRLEEKAAITLRCHDRCATNGPRDRDAQR